MKRITILFSFLIVCLITVAQTPTAAPKPAPELKQLHLFLGHWTYECEYQAGPLGPASKSTGEYTDQMVLGGFFMKGVWKEKGPNGEAEGLEIFGYDPASKTIAGNGYMNDGSTYSGTVTTNGNTATNAVKFVIGGKTYETKATITYAADGMSAEWKAEISDGKTWVPWFEQKMTKVKPAAKK